MPGGGDRAGDDDDLEVVELEPTEPVKRRREPSTKATSHHRRLPVVIAIVVLATLTGSVIASRSRDSNRPSRTTLPRRAGVAPLFPFRVGAQMLTGGLNGLLLVDTDTGRVTVPKIAGLSAGPTTIVAHSGGTVAVSVGDRLSWFTMRDRVAHAVDATGAFPAALGNGLWLTDFRTATLVPPPPAGDAPSIETSGRPLGATSSGLVISTTAGVLVKPTDSRPARVLIRAPATVIGVHGDRVAWVGDECGVLRCPIHVTEVATGATSSWLQLTGQPNGESLERVSAVFSPAGDFVAITMPHPEVAGAQTAPQLVVADLRSRATIAVETRGRFALPQPPDGAREASSTLDWTLDGHFLLLAPASGAGPIGALEPGTPRIVSSRAPLGYVTTTAAIGTSTQGLLDDLANARPRPIDSGGPTQFGTRGLTLVGVDDGAVDVVDIDAQRLTTWPVPGSRPEEEANTIARITGGWLVVRGTSVFRLDDGGGASRTTRISAGSQVFSANHGRDAWIATEAAGLLWKVTPYDPATNALGRAVTAGTPVGAVDDGLLATGDVAFLGSGFDIVDRSGHVRRGPVIDSRSITVLAAAGTHVVLLGSGGLFVLDLANDTNRLVTDRAVFETALSADGTVLAWIEAGSHDPSSRHVMGTAVDGTMVVTLGGPAERVVAADDGTVLFTGAEGIRSGTVYANGSKPVYGFAPAPSAVLAFGFEPPPPVLNLGPNSLP